MKTMVIHRRQVLRGAGGFTLGLPFLASLATPRGALGQAVPVRRPRFIAFTTNHGGIDGPAMYPAAALLTERQELFAGHAIAHGRLVRKSEGADALVSAVLRAPASLFSEALVGKMNVLRGLDIPFYIGHHTGGHLGNYARNDGNGSDGRMVQGQPLPTIDQLLAWSPSFYRDLAGTKERSLVVGARRGLSWNHSNPAARSGPVQEVPGESSSLSLFTRIFIPPTSTPVPSRPLIVDRVMEGYRSLRTGSRRLSGEDRQRLDDHLSRLAELQRRLEVGNRPASCQGVVRPGSEADQIPNRYTDPGSARRRAQLYNDVIVAAFMCGTSRIAVHGIDEPFSGFAGDWHQDVAHRHTQAGPQQILAEGLRQTFQGAVLDLASKLDVPEAAGATYLDNSLLAWSQESGQATHVSTSIPVVTFGGAAGALRTGLFVDYRNQTPGALVRSDAVLPDYVGLTYNRWLGTVLQVMGLPRSEYETAGVPGYGLPYVSAEYSKGYRPGVVASAGDKLPVIAV